MATNARQARQAALEAAAESRQVHDSLPVALLALMAELPKVSKGRTATVLTKTGGQYSYKYADLVDVTDAMYPLLVKHGLTFTTSSRHVDGGAYEIVGLLRHAQTGQSDQAALPLYGRSPQELGSAITYARRYLLGMMTGLVTDEDTDAAGADHGRAQLQGPPPPEPTPQELLSAARWRAWEAYKAVEGPETPTEAFPPAYEQWCAQPFVDATPADFDKFAAHLKGQQG